MNRADLQHLAALRLKEAGVLLDASCFEGAYYLAGYAIECAIKACFARKTEQYDFPSIKAVNQVYSHDPTKLISAAGRAKKRAKKMKYNPTPQEDLGLLKK